MCKYNINGEEINNIINNVGINGHINYSSFLAAVMNKKKLLNEKMLHQIFNKLDMDKDGYISVIDFQKALNRTGKVKNLESISLMFEEAGVEGKIGCSSFCFILDSDSEKRLSV
jgi:Ca2+-binding EF-hand superfamily protein